MSKTYREHCSAYIGKRMFEFFKVEPLTWYLGPSGDPSEYSNPFLRYIVNTFPELLRNSSIPE